jgi:hypothetical protein
MLIKILIAALVFAWFLFLANLAYRIILKNFSGQNGKEETHHFTRNL